MPAQEATSTYPTTRSNISMWWHILAVFLLDVCFIYFFEPENPIYCALLAIIFWKLVWDDHNSTTIDLRNLAVFFILGLFIRNHGIVFSFYAGVTSFMRCMKHLLYWFRRVPEPQKGSSITSLLFPIAPKTMHRPIFLVLPELSSSCSHIIL